MTGPGRSPSSPWVQNAQGGHHDGGVTQSFQSTMSPPNMGMMSNAAFTELSSPNYFGMAVQDSNNQQSSHLGTSAHKHWGTLSNTQRLPSAKPHECPQEPVPAGLMNLLQNEPETNRGSSMHDPSSSRMASWSQPSPAHPLANVSLGQHGGLKPVGPKDLVHTLPGKVTLDFDPGSFCLSSHFT
jgi:hypothetical protein